MRSLFPRALISRRRFSVLALCVAAVTILLPFSARADTLTLGPSQDNSIFQNNVNNSSGGGPGIFSGANGMSSPRRGLIEFNLAGSIPSNATITGVQLQLTVGQLGGNATFGRTVGLYTLVSGWGEGTAGASTTIGGTGQGAAAGTGDATWNANRYNVSTWMTPGGDFASTASASASLGTVSVGSVFTWSSAGLVSDVQNWLNNPASNNGWELINGAETTSQSLLGFYSREGQQVGGITASQLPQLTITYTVPEPATNIALLAGAGLLILRTVRQRWRRA
ncbi:MAG: DNRLRE domain-containing protein [Rhodospirillales bacterium]|nr:DNRLRE domain-containing protein [Acetobacter sp.]